ncbi:MAG: hypothetical protein U0326_40825 [Polyangiales bacterium]
MAPLRAEVTTLPSGVRVALVAMPHTERAAIELRYDVGSSNDPLGRPQLHHLIEHLVLRTTRVEGAVASRPSSAASRRARLGRRRLRPRPRRSHPRSPSRSTRLTRTRCSSAGSRRSASPTTTSPSTWSPSGSCGAREELVRPGIAATAAARELSMVGVSVFMLDVPAARGVEHATLQRRVLDMLARMSAEGISEAQLRPLVDETLTTLARRSRLPLAVAGLGSLTEDPEDPGSLRSLAARYRAITPGAVHQALRRWLIERPGRVFHAQVGAPPRARIRGRGGAVSARRVLMAGLVAAACLAAPARGAAQEAPLLGPTTEASAVRSAMLSNGLQVLMVPRDWTTEVSVTLACERAGDEDRRQEAGVAQLAARAVADAIERRCDVFASTVVDHGSARFSLTASAGGIECAVRTVAVAAQTGALTDASLGALREQLAVSARSSSRSEAFDADALAWVFGRDIPSRARSIPRPSRWPRRRVIGCARSSRPATTPRAACWPPSVGSIPRRCSPRSNARPGDGLPRASRCGR